MKTAKSLNIKGYTMIELMITLMIFAIVTLFAVPAFFTFIEKSRAKSQIAQAANFMRSAQEIAISSNRVVYVFTEGMRTYETDEAKVRADYWTKDWIMAFKPMGKTYINMPQQVTEIIDHTANYTIARQRIFTRSNRYVLSTIFSKHHNNISLNRTDADTDKEFMEMEGYSEIDAAKAANQVYGLLTGSPSFITFYPSGEVSMPIFIVSERTPIKEKISPSSLTPFEAYSFRFDTKPKNGVTAYQWNAELQQKFHKPIALLAGCRMGRSLSSDHINYTFNPNVLRSEFIFNTTGIDTASAFGLSFRKTESNVHYQAAPSFGQFLCGSKFLR